MRNERAILCGPVGDISLQVNDLRPLRLNLFGPHKNVMMEIQDVTSSMTKNLPSIYLDLIDIAAYVYCADQCIRRGGSGTDELGSQWRRNLFFRIAVRNPEVWRSNTVLSRLTSTLSFLSDDEYHFDFQPLTEAPPHQQYFQFKDDSFAESAQDVVMFSGGLDSLAGAVQESLIAKRPVMLVNHRSTPKVAARHNALVRALATRAGQSAPIHIPVRINKEKRLGVEHSQRARAFLFVSLGTLIAKMAGFNRLKFYENGVVSLNLPPSAQIVGARATRTTHPRALRSFSELISCLSEQPFVIDNPFQWKTKTEVIELLAREGCSTLIGSSNSCANTWGRTKQHTHCGICSQCIDRRFAVLAAGQEEHDPRDHYEVDLLLGERKPGLSQAMLMAYVEMVTRIEEMSANDFFSHFGEATRVLRYIEQSPDTAALKIFELYKRHAHQISRVIDGAISKHSAEIRKQQIPATCLLRLIYDSSSTPPSISPPHSTIDKSASAYFFGRSGRAWNFRFAGGRTYVLLPSVGASYLHLLLSYPNRVFAATELHQLVNHNAQELAFGAAVDRVDRETLRGYHQRLSELREQESEAASTNDTLSLDEIQREIAWILDEVRKSEGLQGEIRPVLDNKERIRKSVGNAIRRAIGQIRGYDTGFADHLGPPYLRCGTRLQYSPPAEIQWETDESPELFREKSALHAM